jgi:kinesin family protein 18/19
LPTPSSSGPPDVANIRVAVRVRPENAAESAGNHKHVIEVVDDRMLIFDPNETGDEFFYGGKKQNRRDVAKRANRDHKFAFDVVFGPDSTNEDVFQHTTRDLVDVLFSGYNCSGEKTRTLVFFRGLKTPPCSCINFLCIVFWW